MTCDNLSPDLVWYCGTPFEGSRAAFSGRRTDDGRTYTFIWTQERLARQFLAKCPSADYFLQSAPIGMIMAALACSRFKWVVIDLPEEIDGVLDNPAFRKLNCTRSGDVWPYISTFASRFGIPQDCAGELAEYAKANPELPPMELLANFTSLINERTRSLSDMAEKGGPTRRPIPKAVQREVWRRDQGRCVECGSKENLEFDHIIPVSRGGANTTRNIQLMCESCNRRKSNKEPGV